MQSLQAPARAPRVSWPCAASTSLGSRPVAACAVARTPSKKGTKDLVVNGKFVPPGDSKWNMTYYPKGPDTKHQEKDWCVAALQCHVLKPA